MADNKTGFNPDYAVPPGWILEEQLEARGMSQALFARRCGRSAKLISNIIAGKASVEPETALQFEKVLGVSADMWLGVEKDYRLRMLREKAEAKNAKHHKWVNGFPVKYLVGNGYIRKPESKTDAVSALLSFFGVASVGAWHNGLGKKAVAYRKNDNKESYRKSLAVWQRIGEIIADDQDRPYYKKEEFEKAVRKIRDKFLISGANNNINDAISICNKAGVAVALTPPVPGAFAMGAAWWITPNKPIILISVDHNSSDDFWFTFFHEAAHILFHRNKRSVFIDDDDLKSYDDALEFEANAWAAEALAYNRSLEELLAEAKTQPGFFGRIAGYMLKQRILERRGLGNAN